MKKNKLSYIVVLLFTSCVTFRGGLDVETLDFDRALFFQYSTNFEDFLLKLAEDKVISDDLFYQYAKKYLNDNNFLFWFCLHQYKIKELSQQYEIVEVRWDYDLIFQMMMANRSPITKESLSNFKYEIKSQIIERSDVFSGEKFKSTQRIAYGSMDFNIVNVIKGRMIFTAVEMDENIWYLDELRIPLRGSSKMEDGILIYKTNIKERNDEFYRGIQKEFYQTLNSDEKK